MLMRLALLVVLVVGARAQEVALTFDDLPRHGALPPGVSRVDVARSLVEALTEGDVPTTYGFMNAQRMEEDATGADVLRVWLDSGFPLASHAYSHMDLHANSVEAFREDIDRNEAALLSLMGERNWHWFRYPYLREGNTLEKRREVRAYLKEKGYRTAQVTLDFEDYLWNAPYARCMAKRDAAAVEELKASYLRVAAEYIRLGQQLSQLIYDRDVKHTMLLHIGAFGALMTPALLELLEDLNFSLITLEAAHSDVAYESDPDVATERGETLLEQMMIANQLAYPEFKKKPYEELQGFCR